MASESLEDDVRRAEDAGREARLERGRVARRRDRMRARRDKALADAAKARQDLAEIQAVVKNFDDWRLSAEQSWALALVRAAAGEREKLRNDWTALRDRLTESHDVKLAELADLHGRFVRGLVFTCILVLILTVAIAVVVPALNEEEWFGPWFESALETWAIALAIGAGVIVVVGIGLLTAYHRELSQRRQTLRVQSARITAARAEIDHLRSERIRLKSLGDQLPEFLLLMSETIHRPWVLPAGQPALTAVPRPSLDTLPGHMRLAEPMIQLGDAQALARVREAVALHLRPGWRLESFQQLLELCARDLALPLDAFAEQALDTSSAQRKVFTDHLISRIPNRKESDSHPQVVLGKRVVRAIAIEYRQALLGHQLETFPLVHEFTTDALSTADLRSDQLIEAMSSEATPWNGFLAELLAPAPTMSWYDLSNQAKGSLYQEIGNADVQAICLGPSRLRQLATHSMTYEALNESVLPPVEVLVRIDLRKLSGTEDLFLFERNALEDDGSPVAIREKIPLSRRGGNLPDLASITDRIDDASWPDLRQGS